MRRKRHGELARSLDGLADATVNLAEATARVSARAVREDVPFQEAARRDEADLLRETKQRLYGDLCEKYGHTPAVERDECCTCGEVIDRGEDG